jgi:hypothetical protein
MMNALGRRWFGVFCWVVLGGAITAGCSGKVEDGDGNGNGNESSYCGKAISKFQGCRLIPQNTAVECDEPEEDDDRCAAQCFITMSCTELTAALCNAKLEGLQRCVEACNQDSSSGNESDCGNGETYENAARCDGYDDCSNGADETNCPVFNCKNGSTIAPDYQCDGFDDCGDNSDETGCPVFNCKNGSTIAPDYQCDGSDDCGDNSDETNCPRPIDEVLICS